MPWTKTVDEIVEPSKRVERVTYQSTSLYDLHDVVASSIGQERSSTRIAAPESLTRLEPDAPLVLALLNSVVYLGQLERVDCVEAVRFDQSGAIVISCVHVTQVDDRVNLEQRYYGFYVSKREPVT